MTDADPPATEESPSRPAHQLSPALIKDNLVPVVTPLTSTGEVDANAIDRLVKFHATTLATRALFTVGGLGRFFALTDDQRIKAAGAFVKSNRRHGSKLVIFAGATSETSDGALANLCRMADAGADAVFVAPLYFLLPAEVPTFVRRAREALGPNIPLLLYNNPDFSRMCKSDAPRATKNLTPETLRKVTEDASAVKDSSTDPDLFSKYMDASEGRMSLYTGDEPHLVHYVKRRGSSGCVGGLGNVTSTAGRLARSLAAAAAEVAAVDGGEGETDNESNRTEMKSSATSDLTIKFDGEVAALRRIIESHPDVPAPDVVAAVMHHCLSQAGLIQPYPEELLKILSAEDASFLRENGFIPNP